MIANDDEILDRLTSLAVGLAFSNRDDPDAIRELIEIAGGQPQLLRQARSRVAGLQVGDPGTHHTASQLLNEAARRCDQGRPESDNPPADT